MRCAVLRCRRIRKEIEDRLELAPRYRAVVLALLFAYRTLAFAGRIHLQKSKHSCLIPKLELSMLVEKASDRSIRDAVPE